MKSEHLLRETVFLNRSSYVDAERSYAFRNKKSESTPLNLTKQPNENATVLSISEEVNKIRKQIKTHMEDDSHDAVKVSELVERLNKVESENKSLKTLLVQLENRLGVLEKKTGIKSSFVNTNSKPLTPTVVKKNDDDFDLFDDDEEDSEEKQRIKEERLKQYADKKAGKKEVIAKSSILLDVKPWDDETDMKALEAAVRGITIDGLIWGQSKLIPVAYGVKKLQIGCVIEDDKVSTEALDEQICAFDDYVQSVDIAAFNKI